MVLIKVILGCNYTIKWDDVLEKDPDFQVVFKSKKNFDRTYLYILKLNKSKEINV
jgi:hypothetical protein